MADPHVVTALKDKRSRVASDLDAAKLRVMVLRMDLEALDRSLKLFKADYDPKECPPPRRTFGKNPAALPKGAGSRLALDVLRETGEALSCSELATRVLVKLGKEPEAKAVHMLGVTIHSTFTRTKKAPVTLDRSTYPGRWRLAVENNGPHNTA